MSRKRTDHWLLEIWTDTAYWGTILTIAIGAVIGAALVIVVGREWAYAIGFILGAWTNTVAGIVREKATTVRS